VWVQGVVDGLGLVEALGSRWALRSRQRRQIRASALLQDERVFNILLERLHLAGELARAKELITWRALKVVADAVKGKDLDAAMKAITVLKPAGNGHSHKPKQPPGKNPGGVAPVHPRAQKHSAAAVLAEVLPPAPLPAVHQGDVQGQAHPYPQGDGGRASAGNSHGPSISHPPSEEK